MNAAPSQPQTAPRYSWAEVWTAVLTRPSINTFQEILRDAGATRNRAYLWMGITWVMTIVFMAFIMPTDLDAVRAQLPPDMAMEVSNATLQSSLFMSTLCAIPLVLIVAMGVFRLMAWVAQIIARMMGGTVKNESGTHVIYSFAAIQAPLNVISLLFLSLPANPIVGLISLAATFYQFLLMTLAIRAIYGLSWGRAFVPIAPFVSILLLTLFGLSAMM